jgi:hypothetical protein
MGAMNDIIGYYLTKKKKTGLAEKGNIVLGNQPVVKNPAGGYSTVYSGTFTDDKGRVLVLPRVAHDGSGILTEDEAWKQYLKTGKHLGIFYDQDSADAYSQKLHKDYESGKIKMKER